MASPETKQGDSLQRKYYCQVNLKAQTMNVVMELSAEKCERPKRYVLLIDVSGSMDRKINNHHDQQPASSKPQPSTNNQQPVSNNSQSSKSSKNDDQEPKTLLDQVKLSAKKTVDEMKEGDWLSIVEFSRKTNTKLPMTKLTDKKKDKDNAKKVIGQLKTVEGTNLENGMDGALDEIKNDLESGEASLDCILLFTDGAPTGGEKNAEKFIERYKQKQKDAKKTWKLLVFSTGGDRQDFLEKIASGLGGDSLVLLSNKNDLKDSKTNNNSMDSKTNHDLKDSKQNHTSGGAKTNHDSRDPKKETNIFLRGLTSISDIDITVESLENSYFNVSANKDAHFVDTQDVRNDEKEEAKKGPTKLSYQINSLSYSNPQKIYFNVVMPNMSSNKTKDEADPERKLVKILVKYCHVGQDIPKPELEDYIDSKSIIECRPDTPQNGGEQRDISGFMRESNDTKSSPEMAKDAIIKVAEENCKLVCKNAVAEATRNSGSMIEPFLEKARGEIRAILKKTKEIVGKEPTTSFDRILAELDKTLDKNCKSKGAGINRFKRSIVLHLLQNVSRNTVSRTAKGQQSNDEGKGGLQSAISSKLEGNTSSDLQRSSGIGITRSDIVGPPADQVTVERHEMHQLLEKSKGIFADGSENNAKLNGLCKELKLMLEQAKKDPMKPSKSTQTFPRDDASRGTQPFSTTNKEKERTKDLAEKRAPKKANPENTLQNAIDEEDNEKIERALPDLKQANVTNNGLINDAKCKKKRKTERQKTSEDEAKRRTERDMRRIKKILKSGIRSRDIKKLKLGMNEFKYKNFKDSELPIFITARALLAQLEIEEMRKQLQAAIESRVIKTLKKALGEFKTNNFKESDLPEAITAEDLLAKLENKLKKMRRKLQAALESKAIKTLAQALKKFKTSNFEESELPEAIAAKNLLVKLEKELAEMRRKLQAAIESRVIKTLKRALNKFETSNFKESDLPETIIAKDLLTKLENKLEKMRKKLQAAIESKVIKTLTQALEKFKTSYFEESELPEAITAKDLLVKLENELAEMRRKLQAAIESRVIKTLKQALEEFETSNFKESDLPETIFAKNLLTQLENKLEKLRKKLQAAIESRFIKTLEQALYEFQTSNFEESELPEAITAKDLLLDLKKMRNKLKVAIESRKLKLLKSAVKKADEDKYIGRLNTKRKRAKELINFLGEIEDLRKEMKEMTRRAIFEVHSYPNPPEPIIKIMKALFTILGESQEAIQEWRKIQALMRKLDEDSLRKRVDRFEQKDLSSKAAKKADGHLKNINLHKDRVTSFEATEKAGKHSENTCLHEVKDVSKVAGTFYARAKFIVEEVKRLKEQVDKTENEYVKNHDREESESDTE